MSSDAAPPPDGPAAAAPPAGPAAGDENAHDDGHDDGHDDDLAAFVRAQQPRRSVHPVRVVLAVAATIAVGSILLPTTDELAYHLSRQASPVDLVDGSAAVLARVPDGTWVRANVVIGNKAAEIPEWRKGSLRMGPIEVREVVGAPLFIEFDPKRWPALDPFVQTDVEGRLVSFGPDGELAEVRGYFTDRLRAAVSPTARAIVVGEKPGGLTTYLTAWIAGVALVVLSWTSVLRRLVGAPTTNSR
jgi:hypothetical protein